jgi:hypothetical protein
MRMRMRMRMLKWDCEVHKVPVLVYLLVAHELCNTHMPLGSLGEPSGSLECVFDIIVNIWDTALSSTCL